MPKRPGCYQTLVADDSKPGIVSGDLRDRFVAATDGYSQLCQDGPLYGKHNDRKQHRGGISLKTEHLTFFRDVSASAELLSLLTI